MPLPKPNKGESQDDFMSRCMGNETAKKDFPDNTQRVAVCFSKWREAHGGEPPAKQRNDPDVVAAIARVQAYYNSPQMAKVSKASANYRLGGPHCHACVFFIEDPNENEMNNTCQKVAGMIGEHDLCDLFQRKQESMDGKRKTLMANSLNSAGRSYANSLISSGKVNKAGSWSFSAADGNALLGPNGDDWAAYGKAHLGVNSGEPNNTKGHWSYPFAKGGTLYRSGLTAIRQRAGQQGDTAIFDAAGTMIDKIDGEGADTEKPEEPGGASTVRIYQFVKPRDKKQPLNYRMQANGDAIDIMLYDSIGGWGISAKEFIADLKKYHNAKTINMRINSDGGDVFEGRAIYTHLAQHPARIIAHIDGIAASISSLIAMAAKEIRMADGAFMMIHDSWTVAMGNANELQQKVDLMRSVDTTIQQTYAARTKQSVADIKKWMSAETWMNAREAVDRGFADVMDEPMKVAAAIRDPSAFRNLPVSLRPNITKANAAISRIAAQIP